MTDKLAFTLCAIALAVLGCIALSLDLPITATEAFTASAVLFIVRAIVWRA